MEDNRIIHEIRNGNRKTLENIYNMYRKGFIEWTTASYRITSDQAVDLYQQAILCLYENIVGGKLDGIKSSLRTYLFAIGKYKTLEIYRYHARVSSLEGAIPDCEAFDAEDGDCNERLLELAKSCLSILGDPCRKVLESYYYHRQSMREIAETLGYKNEQTAKNQKYKCLLRLREIFRQEAEKKKDYIYE